MRRRVVLLAAAALLAAGGAPARAQDPDAALFADASRVGTVSLAFFAQPGTQVRFFEVHRGARRRLGAATVGPAAAVVLPDAVSWRCDRLVREFAADATAPDGTPRAASFTLRTPSCRNRYDVRSPARARVGSRARVRVVDRWRLGAASPALCVRPPGRAAETRCRRLRLARGVPAAGVALRVDEPGRWRLELRHDGYVRRRSIAVGRRAPAERPRPVVLATGDSTLQGVDAFLADRLGERVDVRPELHLGSGISQDGSWIARARRQARGLRPALTVISIGGSEGFPLPAGDGRSVRCCGPDWVALYERRVRLMLRAYLRRGRGRVAWLALPAARDARRNEIAAAVNEAVRRATAGQAGVVLVRLDSVFTPNGYRDTMRWRGRVVRVREADGIHLSAAGTAIAAEVVAEAIRPLGALPRR